MITTFVEGRLILVPAGATAIDALRESDPTKASEVVAGERVITDSRGLPIAPDTPAFDGAIYRVARNRSTQAAEEE